MGTYIQPIVGGHMAISINEDIEDNLLNCRDCGKRSIPIVIIEKYPIVSFGHYDIGDIGNQKCFNKTKLYKQLKDAANDWNNIYGEERKNENENKRRNK